MTDSTDDIDWYDGPETKGSWCDCGCTIRIKRLENRLRAIEKILKKIEYKEFFKKSVPSL